MHTIRSAIDSMNCILYICFFYLYNIYIFICIFAYIIYSTCSFHDSHSNGTSRYILIYTFTSSGSCLQPYFWPFCVLFLYGSIIVFFFYISVNCTVREVPLIHLSSFFIHQCLSPLSLFFQTFINVILLDAVTRSTVASTTKVDENRGTNNTNLIS